VASQTPTAKDATASKKGTIQLGGLDSSADGFVPKKGHHHAQRRGFRRRQHHNEYRLDEQQRRDSAVASRWPTARIATTFNRKGTIRFGGAGFTAADDFIPKTDMAHEDLAALTVSQTLPPEASPPGPPLELVHWTSSDRVPERVAAVGGIVRQRPQGPGPPHRGGRRRGPGPRSVGDEEVKELDAHAHVELVRLGREPDPFTDGLAAGAALERVQPPNADHARGLVVADESSVQRWLQDPGLGCSTTKHT
jgi:hypothetical protein